MKPFTNIARAKQIPSATAAALGLKDINGENRLEVRNEGDRAKIYLMGSVGKSWLDDSGISESEVRDALESIPSGKPITVHINSEGGSVQEGLGIYNAFKARSGDITCRIDGYALSIASIIPLAASKVISPDSAIWMTHKAWSWGQGNADEMRQQATMLEEHDAVLAEIYARETGKTVDEWKALMAAETWIRGSKALDFGLADEGDDKDEDTSQGSYHPPIHSAYIQRCKNAAPEILNAINARTASALKAMSAPLSGAELPQNSAPQPGANNPKQIMDKTKMLALLNKWGVKVPDNSTDEQILALVEAGKPVATVPTPAPAAAAPEAKDSAEVIALRASVAAINAKLERETTDRITRAVDQLVVDTKLTTEERPKALARALKDESYLTELQERPVANFGTSGVGPSVQILSENPLEKIYAEKDPAKRHAALASDWDGLISDAIARDSRGDKCRISNPHARRAGGLPVAANTYSATLVTAFLGDGATTVLQKKLAALAAFSKNWSTDQYKPLATGVLKKVTAGSTTLTNATNFEQGDSTIAPVSVTVAQYTQPFQVSNSDLNNGLRMADLVTVNAAAFANKLMQVATAPITEANFANYSGGSYIAAPAAFGWGDMSLLWGALKLANFRHAVLDGEYIGQLNNTPTFFQNPGVAGGGAMNFGWDGIHLNTEWTGAGAGVRGFVCDTQALGTVIGLPLTPTSAGSPIPGSTMSESTFQVPGLGITVAQYMWFSLSSRTFWASYDIMLGASALDTTAGVIVKAA